MGAGQRTSAVGAGAERLGLGFDARGSAGADGASGRKHGAGGLHHRRSGRGHGSALRDSGRAVCGCCGRDDAARLFHAHLGASDFAHAATWFLATLAFYHATGSRRWWAPLLAGLGLGLALLTKINAVLLLPYWTIWLLIYRRNSRAWFVFLLSLPVALARPDRRLAVDLGKPSGRPGELGQVLPCPFRDPPVVRRQALREDAVVSCPRHGGHHDAGGVAGAGRRRPLQQGEGGPDSDRRWNGSEADVFIISEWNGLQLIGILIVVGYYMLPITAIHDQERLLLPAFLQLAVLAGGGFALLYGSAGACAGRRFRARGAGFGRIARWLLGAGLAILLLLPGFLGIIRLHPFELSYYNEVVGGTAGARRLGMETTYYASTYGHFLPALNDLPAGSKLWVMPNSWDVIYYYQRNGLLA